MFHDPLIMHLRSINLSMLLAVGDRVNFACPREEALLNIFPVIAFKGVKYAKVLILA